LVSALQAVPQFRVNVKVEEWEALPACAVTVTVADFDDGVEAPPPHAVIVPKAKVLATTESLNNQGYFLLHTMHATAAKNVTGTIGPRIGPFKVASPAALRSWWYLPATPLA
jgi:hypothetical protein